MSFNSNRNNTMARKLEDRDTITRRLAETAKETQRLKEELQNLIASGIPGKLDLPITDKKVELNRDRSPSASVSANKVQIIKSFDSKSSQHMKNPPEKSPQAEMKKSSLSPIKSKNYDVQQTKDYIKKQRGKRMAEMKSKNTDSKANKELRKEKLQELHQKASELVKRNVEAKRSRSRSREPPIMHSRSVDHNLDKSGRISVIQGYNCAGKSKNLAATLKLSAEKSPTSLHPLNDLPPKETASKPPRYDLYDSHRDPNRLQVPHWDNWEKSRHELVNRPIKTKAKSCEELSRDMNNSFIQPTKQSSVITHPQMDETQKSKNLIEKPRKLVEVLKNVKETAATGKECLDLRPTMVDWFKPSTPQIDPHNFINTVKRQLFPTSGDQETKSLFNNKPSASIISNDKICKPSDVKTTHWETSDGKKLKPSGSHSSRTSMQFNNGNMKKNEQYLKSSSESDTAKGVPSISSECDVMSKEIIKKIEKILLPENNTDLVKSDQENCEYEDTFDYTKPTATSNVNDVNTKQTTKTSSEKTHSKEINLEAIESNPIASKRWNSNADNVGKNGNYLSLKEPKMSLKISSNKKMSKESIVKNITFRQGQLQTGNNDHANELHLKFEAEIHLLNDFNKSLRHFSEIEKAFESLRLQNNPEVVTKKVLENRDTQTSVISKAAINPSSKLSEVHEITSQISTINYTRGSSAESVNNQLKRHDEILAEGDENKSLMSFNLNALELTDKSEWNKLFESVDFDDTLVESFSYDTIKSFECVQDENSLFKNVAGISVKMFDQLIKDEDIRIDNLKKMVKCREQALLDKTRSELVWLDMQKKQFLKTRKLDEVSMIKRKQRGILLRLQQDRHEMQRLKQMQKEASKKRKTVLKQQRNHIKSQLHSDNMLSKLKTNNYRERTEGRASGPLKVIQPGSSSFSFNANNDQISNPVTECKSGMSQAYSFKALGTASSSSLSELRVPSEQRPSNSEVFTTACKNLLMRQQALRKRRKEVEGLLQWHNELKQEEKAIKALEDKMKAVVTRIPNVEDHEGGEDERGIAEDGGEKQQEQQCCHHHNQLQPDAAIIESPKDKLPTVILSAKSSSSLSSPSSLADFNNAAINLKETRYIPENQNDHDEAIGTETLNNYSADFEPEDDKSSISSISQLIEDFTKIEGNIKNLSLVHKEEEIPEEIKDKITEEEEKEDADHYLSSQHVETMYENITEESPNSTINSEDLADDKIITEQDNLVNQVSDNNQNTEIPQLSLIASDSEKPQIVEDLSSMKESLTTPSIEEYIYSNIEDRPTQEDSHIPEVNDESIFPEQEDINIDLVVDTVLEQIESDHDVSITTADELQHSASSLHSEIQEMNEISNNEQKEEMVKVEETVVALAENNQTTESQLVLLDTAANNEHYENKTDEEKVASLTNQRSHVQHSNSELIPSVIILSDVCIKSPLTSEEYSQTTISSEILSIEVQPPQENKVETTIIPETVVEEEIITPNNSACNLETEIDSEQEERKSKSPTTFGPLGSRKYLVEKRSLDSSSTSTSSSSSNSSSRSNSCSPRKKSSSPIDVKKRAYEILNEATPKSSAESRSVRRQELCTITYDLSPIQSPDSSSLSSIENRSASLGSEAEELLKKQIAIEQEIKLLTEQQQKEQAPLPYIREIPNKPPPPYTPPASKLKTKKSPSVQPKTKEEIQQITEYSAKIIHKAYLSNNLDNLCLSDKTLSLIAKNIDKSCYKFVFDLCKEIALDHYNCYAREHPGPSWLKIDRKPFSTRFQNMSPTVTDLQQLMNEKLLELFHFQKAAVRKENSIMKWSRKKRDHIDEVIVQEMQNEEALWTNYDEDELIVKDKVTNEIMDMLLKDTAEVLERTVRKKQEEFKA